MGILLGLLTGLALLLRSLSVSSLPPELFGDEIDVGYQAYSLYRTGKDLYSQPLPVYIHSLAEWRAPLLMYFTVPTVAIFGLTEWGVRAPEIILGSLAPLILFILVRRAGGNRPQALFSALVLALSPWHIFYSRAAFEAVILLDFLLLGTILYLRRQPAPALLFFCLTPYIYSTAVVFVPLWLAGLYQISGRPRLSVRHLWPGLLLLPFVWTLFFGKAGERFAKIGQFTDPVIADEITVMRSRSASPWERIFTNKVTYSVRQIAANYLTAFSPQFLFLKGDITARHSLGFIGQLFPVWAPLLVIGLLYLIKQRQYLWLVWLLLAPVPAALTADGGYHATRLFILLPPLAVAIGSGWLQLKSWLSARISRVAYLGYWLVFAFQFAAAAHYYVYHYPMIGWRWWHVGFRSAMTELNRLAPSYKGIFINNTYEPALIRFLFYTGYSPADFQRHFVLDQPSANIAPEYYGFFLAPKYYFGGFSPGPNRSLVDVMQPGNLYLISQRDDLPGDWDWRTSPPGGVRVLYTSTDPTGFPIFYLVTKT